MGILGAYGVLHPVAHAIETRAEAEHAYLDCIKTGILSFARGDAPLTSVEFARRAIGGEARPSFAEVEEITQAAQNSAGKAA